MSTIFGVMHYKSPPVRIVAARAPVIMVATPLFKRCYSISNEAMCNVVRVNGHVDF